MTGDPTAFALEEYRALRATIRERGSLRLLVIALTIVTWAAAALASVALGRWPGTSLIPLLVLAAGFEVAFAAHVGVERVGRYLQVRFESEAGNHGPRWELTAMALGRLGHPGGGVDPIGRLLFASAGAVNLLPALSLLLIRPAQPAALLWAGAETLAHGLFLYRLTVAARFVREQRDVDLAALRSNDLVSGIQSPPER